MWCSGRKIDRYANMLVTVSLLVESAAKHRHHSATAHCDFTAIKRTLGAVAEEHNQCYITN